MAVVALPATVKRKGEAAASDAASFDEVVVERYEKESAVSWVPMDRGIDYGRRSP